MQYHWLSHGTRISWAPGRHRRFYVVAAFAIFYVLWYLAGLNTSTSYGVRGHFEALKILGFVNSGRAGRSCNDIKHDGTLGVQRSIMLNDDLLKVAEELRSHPMVIYPKHLQDPTLDRNRVVSETWGRLSGSCAFLSDYRVFLCATRIIFFDEGERDEPVISFIRGQLFNQDWVHLDNHTIQWQDKSMTFPLIFDVHSFYEPGGLFFGPEDPRIIIEDAQGAEPVIIFNMQSEAIEYIREMWVFRPFSGHSTRLFSRDEKLRRKEKNWTPIFLSCTASSPTDATRSQSKPSHHLHFIYSFDPLRILKCDLVTGECAFVFHQDALDDRTTLRDNVPGQLRGGTNFVPVPLPSPPLEQATVHSTAPPMRVYLGFPRTSIRGSCPEPFYRPQLVIMITDGDHFHLAYASDSIEFGSSLFDPVATAADPCGAGRIVIANSISQWDTNERDIMTITVSVDDATVQVVHLEGVLDFVTGLPGLQEFIHRQEQAPAEESVTYRKHLLKQYSLAGDDVKYCSVEAAWNYTVAYTEDWRVAHPEVYKAYEDKIKALQERPQV